MEREFPFNDLPSGCQFPKEDLIEWNGETYCEFHLPLTNDVGNPRKDWNSSNYAVFNNKIMDYATIKSANEAIDLTGVVFPCDIDFSSLQTLSNICLQQAVFMHASNFMDINFHGINSFIEATFKQSANFQRTKFRSKANFRKANFLKEVDFETATFYGEAIFISTTFTEKVSPICTANFSGATFYKNAFFWGGKFGGSASFAGIPGTDTSFNSLCDFSNAAFFFHADFANCHFHKTTFRDTTFAMAPEFFDSELHPGTVFPSQNNFKDIKDPFSIAAYRCLKQKMSDIHAHHEQQMFYALEQKSRLNQPETPKMEKLFSLLYWLTSDYGQSIGRPVGWIIGTIFLYHNAYFNLGGTNPDKAFGFSVQQLVRPFAIWGKNDDPWSIALVDANPIAVFSLATSQSIFSLALITLFLLAVRRRFKLQ